MKLREELDKLREMSDDDLREEALRLKESVFRLSFKLALGEVDAIPRVRREKKTLSRVRTLISEREKQARAS